MENLQFTVTPPVITDKWASHLSGLYFLALDDFVQSVVYWLMHRIGNMFPQMNVITDVKGGTSAVQKTKDKLSPAT